MVLNSLYVGVYVHINLNTMKILLNTHILNLYGIDVYINIKTV